MNNKLTIKSNLRLIVDGSIKRFKDNEIKIMLGWLDSAGYNFDNYFSILNSYYNPDEGVKEVLRGRT